MDCIGLIAVGDYALATGRDLHVQAVARLIAADDVVLAFASFVPADPVAIAAALHDALQRPHTVVCFGGMGSHADDLSWAALGALQQGRSEVGLARWPETQVGGVSQVGNVVLLPGSAERAHAQFAAWWEASRATDARAALPSERLPWRLPVTPLADAARRQIRVDYPLVRQRLISDQHGRIQLMLTGPSRGKTQAARKALQRLLAASGSPAVRAET